MDYIPFQHLAAYVAEATPEGLCPYFHRSGIGTLMDPLRLVMVLRHPDMGDEATFTEACTRTEEVGDALASVLAAELTSSTRYTLDQLEHVLSLGQKEAEKTDDYYSAGATVLIDKQLVIVGIGRMKVWLWRKGTLSVLMEPTVMSIPERPNLAGVLTAALGIGFVSNKVQSCELQLEADDLVVLVGSGFSQQLNPDVFDQAKDIISAEELLHFLKDRSEKKPSLIAILGAGQEL